MLYAMGGHESLKTPPDNLKDAIDWILWFWAYGRTASAETTNYEKLAKFLEENPEFTDAKNQALGPSMSPEGVIKNLAEDRLKYFLGYDSQGTDDFSGDGIVRKDGAHKSSYHNAHWDHSDEPTYAKIFLLLSCLAYYFITFLYWACKNKWKIKKIQSTGSGSPLYYLFNAMDYVQSQLYEEKTGSAIAGSLGGEHGFPELKEAYDTGGSSSYSTFIEKLEGNGSKHALSCPLTNCKIFSYAYLQSKQIDTGITVAIDEIKKELVTLSTSSDISSTNNFSALQQKITKFLGKIQSFDPNSGSSGSGSASTRHPGSSEPGSDGPQKAGSSGTDGTSQAQSSSAGPAVGGLLGVGTLGAGAAYGLNLDSLSSAPVNPSLDCPSNLKEAIDWLLRVAGKDGQGDCDGNGDGQRAIEALTEEVKKLLLGVKASVPEPNKKAFAQINQALGTPRDGLFAKLADGLQQFIGHERNLDSAIKKLQSGLGGDQEKFNTAVKEVETQLKSVNGSDVDTILNKLKDIKSLYDKKEISELAKKASEYLKKVLEQVAKDNNVRQHGGQCGSRIENLKTHLVALVDSIGTCGPKPMDLGSNWPHGLKNKFDAVNYGAGGALKELYNAFSSGNLKSQPIARVLVYASYNATSNFIAELQKGYKSSYQSVNVDHVSNPACAKIFLSCLPLIFSNLQHLYWKCKQEKAKGGWKEMQLNGSGNEGADLKHFMDLMTYSSVRLNGTMKGERVVSSAFKNFTEFSTAANNSTTSYAGFLKKFKTTGIEAWKTSRSTASNTNFLSGLYLCSSWYFRHQHQKKAASSRPPSSIREMLYWLSGLQFAPGYRDLEKQIKSVVQPEFKVAISGSPNSDEKLTADKVREYLVTTCLYSPTVFCNIQEPGISDNAGEPWLHSLYSNSEFNFTYPSSGTALLYTLSSYVYALMFQFQFLYKQCEFDYQNGCGWWLCKFGSNVLPKDDTTVPSSFCGSVEVSIGTHYGNKCGLQPDSPSPLQAFLTDNLKGFRRDPSDPYSHLAECTVGSMCHVPMGFKPANLRGLATGGHLMMALKFFCGKPNTPLRQLCGMLSCITKSTPRTLSDVFGFTFHLTGQMFRDARAKDSDTANLITSALKSLIENIPNTMKALCFDVSSDLKEMGSRFFDLSLHCHKVTAPSTVHKRSGHYCTHHTSDKAADLASLSGCTYGNTCGKYLEPLAVSSGTTFANDFASTYLTWALYLTDDIYESLQKFLDRFNSLKCSGCKNDPQCQTHSPGVHASQCRCPSIVQCADALTVLYEYGFHFQDAIWLKGWRYANNRWNTNNANNRNCTTFASQLQAVISGNPLSNLLRSIDNFLFLFRYYFLSNLSGFWAIYIGLILYTFFFLLDTLHLRSHLKLTSSHPVPPLALLTSGKPLPITKLTYITQ
ncbi:variant erythrocyte surface antigen-1 family protein [Babesia caballi]|uniref:Variant erythrocyte surface antigen-1 family protein n=1 Tax=Babesia caballi TaxID=5871 RepID=A0AAV4LZY0_BABCB|nr:variant erythrocyte surface antigen-1 family protein [Babesia caballi]